MKKVLYILCFVVLSGFAVAQNIDSLKLALKNEKNDTIKINILIALVEGISDDHVWPQYNEQMLKLSEKLVQSKEELIRLKGRRGLADAYNNIGFMYNNQGDIPNALDYFGKSLKMQEELGNKDGIAELLGNIGVIYYFQNDAPKALDNYLKSLKIREELGDKAAIANSLNNIGNVFYDMKNMPRAIYYTERSLKLEDEVGDKEGMAYSLGNLGGIYFYKGDVQKALDYYNRSRQVNEVIGNKQGYAASLHNIATVYLKLATELGSAKDKQRYLKLALSYTDSSLVLSKKLGFPANIQTAEKLLSKIDSTGGNYLGAFEHYKQFIFYRDSISNEANQKASIKSQFKYVYEKKEAVLKEQQDKERQLGKEKSRVQQTIIWSVVGGLALVIVFSFFIFRSLLQNRKANKIISSQKKLVEDKNHIIEEKQKEIIDSINYAKRIQHTLFAHEDFLNTNLSPSGGGEGGGHFVYFNPKDIVSGDFFWATKKGNKLYLAVCDSTGHGVPGAFMSLLNIGFLSEAINEKGIEKPNEIFNYVRQRLVENISKDGQKDGFDGALVCFDFPSPEKGFIEMENVTITYSAANNKPLLISDQKMEVLEGDRMPVGIGEKPEDFKLYTVDVKHGDILYLYTDGYADQFGGTKGKKFKYKTLNELIFNNHTKPLREQQVILASTFDNWRGNLEQVDDVCIIGVRI